MSRAPRQQGHVLFLGLFVIFFGLYAREHQRMARAGAGASVVPVPQSVPAPAAAEQAASGAIPVSQRVRELTDALQGDSLFQVHADGLTARYEPDAVTVSFGGDDVYAEGHFAFRETWYTSLDRLASILQPFVARGLRIEITGYTDLGSAKERRPTDYGESDYALSFARAEWVARFLERRALIPIQERVRLTGSGSVKTGRRVDLKFVFDHR
jgi:flagellar motor protein MotB